jgi:hypothetical protein
VADDRSGRPRPAPSPATSSPAAAPLLPIRRRTTPQPGQVVAAAGGAVVAAARFGRLLGRTGWRAARQLPGVAAVEDAIEHGAQRIGAVAVAELRRRADPTPPATATVAASAEELRAMAVVVDGAGDAQPLRTAMSELLSRSVPTGQRRGNEYLFGTIVSQLVPDEARILATLAAAREPGFPVVEVLARQGRANAPSVGNLSNVGEAARVAVPANVPTYLDRLRGFGLIEYGPEAGVLASDYQALERSPDVKDARRRLDRRRRGASRLVRKTLTLSPLGREFWAASAPTA